MSAPVGRPVDRTVRTDDVEARRLKSGRRLRHLRERHQREVGREAASRERGAPQDGDLRRCEHRRHRGDDAGLVEARVAYADRDHLFLVDPRQPRGRRVAVLHPPRRQPCHARTTPRGGRAGCNVHMAKWLLTRPHGTWLHGTWHMAAQREREGWLPRAHIWPPPRGGRQPEHNAWLGRCGGSDAAVTAAVQQLLIVTALNATGAAGGVRPLRRGGGRWPRAR
mmetsp:Transcript_62268/g.171073  ORF Transcript_62268/g.171073 Transcript_62268/m.171073 type:complete len:223 (+) Transcript_62268:257-925(+)